MASQKKEKSLTPLMVLFCLALFAFELIAWDWWRHGPLSQLDFLSLRYAEKLSAIHPWFIELGKLVGVTGEPYFLGTWVILGGIFLAWKKDWPGLILLLLIVVLGNMLVEPVNAWFQRPRPLPGLPGAGGFSFPSGSAYLAAVVYGSLAVLISCHLSQWYKKLGLFLGALTLVFLVGASRLVLRMDWLTDVLGAYALAAAWLTLNFLLYKKIRRTWR